MNRVRMTGRRHLVVAVAALRRHEYGNVSTHWRSPLGGASTRSIRFATVAFIRRPVHDGQKPRPCN